jgi:hypothetical protein
MKLYSPMGRRYNSIAQCQGAEPNHGEWGCAETLAADDDNDNEDDDGNDGNDGNGNGDDGDDGNGNGDDMTMTMTATATATTTTTTMALMLSYHLGDPFNHALPFLVVLDISYRSILVMSILRYLLEIYCTHS